MMFSDYYTFLEVDQQVLTFSIGGQEVAVELKYVKKVDLVSKLMPLPRSPPGVEGIVQIDEEPYPLLNLERLLDPTVPHVPPQIVVLVNAVENLYTIQLSELPNALERIDGEKGSSTLPDKWVKSYVKSGDRSIPLLDMKAIWEGLE